MSTAAVAIAVAGARLPTTTRPSAAAFHLRPPLRSLHCPTLTLTLTHHSTSFAGHTHHRRHHLLSASVAFSTGKEAEGVGREYEEWNEWTAKFAGAANLPFLLLQLPQIVLNARNLMAANNAALHAVPWLGMLTGLLGNLSLVSYFAKKRETGAIVVQTLGVISTYTVILQLALAGAMPLNFFVITSVVVGCGLLLNLLNYFNWLNSKIWQLWEDFTTVGGLSVLPQVMWSTFVPSIPQSILPGIISFTVAILAVILARTGQLPEKGTKFVNSTSGWTATLLFMWMPVAQMWTNFLNPDNIKGLSASTMLLAMVGNGLMIPRAIFIRDLMWFTGSGWACFLYGWGNLYCMYCLKTISKEYLVGATLGLFAWIGIALWKDTKAYGHSTPSTSLKELAMGDHSSKLG